MCMMCIYIYIYLFIYICIYHVQALGGPPGTRRPGRLGARRQGAWPRPLSCPKGCIMTSLRQANFNFRKRIMILENTIQLNASIHCLAEVFSG